MVGEAREERMDGGGRGQVSAGKTEPLGDAERIGSPFIAALGVAEVLTSDCSGENAWGA